ncbi:hypothetical protein BDW59DRAFT_166568 [Aspergillus cavernicola]|uniref:Uncharacterized protein n=1 Tax=Aspergillus cavernicola TaxID=176166 RepID=A0ABR4HLI8_9EURO
MNMVFKTLTLASPNPSPLDGYDLIIPSWEVQFTPDSEPITLNGTIDWDKDFAGTEEEDALVERHFTSLEKGTNFPGAKYNCFGRWERVNSIPTRRGITYLRKVNGHPRAKAGPSTCARVSCSYKAGIYWCNNSKSSKTLNSFGSIADGAQVIVNKCHLGSGIQEYTAGQVFYKTDWNVIVQEVKC